MSKCKKYTQGNKITTMYEFTAYVENLNNTGLFFYGKFLNFAFVLNWHYHWIAIRIKQGNIRKARREDAS